MSLGVLRHPLAFSWSRLWLDERALLRRPETIFHPVRVYLYYFTVTHFPARRCCPHHACGLVSESSCCRTNSVAVVLLLLHLFLSFPYFPHSSAVRPLNTRQTTTTTPIVCIYAFLYYNILLPRPRYLLHIQYRYYTARALHYYSIRPLHITMQLPRLPTFHSTITPDWLGVAPRVCVYAFSRRK